MSRTKHGREIPKQEEAPEVPQDTTEGSSTEETTTDEEIKDDGDS
tara:strand:- start:582 stop:716 length:135 start_codon:yes stop_codon:yes gene_type:complete